MDDDFDDNDDDVDDNSLQFFISSVLHQQPEGQIMVLIYLAQFF
jgi:hypothetical protein